MKLNNRNYKKRRLFGLDIENPKTPYKIFGFVLSIWVLCWLIVGNVPLLKDWSERGQFGDMFGTVNALFSGLAFAGIIYTILLQREELEAQRHELQLTREEFKTQNVTLKRQRFETTFFNMLSLHFQSLERIRAIFTRFDSEILNSLGGKKKEFQPDYLNEYQLVYNDFLKRHYPTLSAYFQSLLSLYDVIKQQKFQSKSERRYLRILNSYISLQEQVFLFYHLTLCKADYVTKNLDDMASDLKLASTKPEHLLHPSHIKLLAHVKR